MGNKSHDAGTFGMKSNGGKEGKVQPKHLQLNPYAVASRDGFRLVRTGYQPSDSRSSP